MKTTASWVAAVALMGCGLGTGLQDSSSTKNNNLNGGGTTLGDDGGIAKASGGGGPECPAPSAPAYACDVEATAFKGCSQSGAPCTAERSAFDACQASAPPPPIDPCEAQNVALKQCVVAGGKCEPEQDATNACFKLNAPPPECTPPPKPRCDGEAEDPCLPILDLFKQCTLKTPGTLCDTILQAFDSCEAQGSTPPPAPSKP